MGGLNLTWDGERERVKVNLELKQGSRHTTDDPEIAVPVPWLRVSHHACVDPQILRRFGGPHFLFI